MSEAAFLRRDFALQWQAHGLRYGIPLDVVEIIRQRRVAVASVSRSVIAEAAARFPTRIIEVTAPANVLAQRLADRRREDAADIKARLARQIVLPSGIDTEKVVNDDTVEVGGERFVRALLRLAGT